MLFLLIGLTVCRLKPMQIFDVVLLIFHMFMSCTVYLSLSPGVYPFPDVFFVVFYESCTAEKSGLVHKDIYEYGK